MAWRKFLVMEWWCRAMGECGRKLLLDTFKVLVIRRQGPMVKPTVLKFWTVLYRVYFLHFVLRNAEDLELDLVMVLVLPIVLDTS